MYIQTLRVEATREKAIQADDGSTSTLYELTLRDQRPKKDGSTYCAFRFKTTFWNTNPGVNEGDVIVIQGDLVNNYYTDKDNNLRTEPVLRNAAILEIFNPTEIAGEVANAGAEAVEEEEEIGF